MNKPNVMNGVNLDDLFGTIEAIKESPSIAKFKFTAKNKWMRGGHNRTTIKDFYGACQTQVRDKAFVFDADEPPVLLGEDQGANPVEYALTALAGCVTTALVYHAAAKGIKIDEVESTLEGDLDLHGFLGLRDDVRNGYEGVNIKFKIKADVPQEKLKEVLMLGPTFSPVYDIFTNAVPVKVMLDQDDMMEKEMMNSEMING
ncbi:MAG: OsmC family protein [Melioribacteraceae bacterium]|nr:OsmC family protein [Melioribacteraceae bacterium]